MTNLNSLSRALEAFFDCSFATLPKSLQETVAYVFKGPFAWDKLSPSKRRGFANYFDLNETHTSDRFWRDWHQSVAKIEAEIKKWESVSPISVGDLAVQEEKLAPLRSALAAEKEAQKWKRLRNEFDPDNPLHASGDEIDTTDKKEIAGDLNHDPKMQARANAIANEKMAQTSRPITRDAVAKILAGELGQDEATVLRRIRKTWGKPSLPKYPKLPK